MKAPLKLYFKKGSDVPNSTLPVLIFRRVVAPNARGKARNFRQTLRRAVGRKNGAVVRKHMGYLHIAAEHAAAIEQFYEEHFNPYLNFHRLCGQPESWLARRCSS